MMTFDKVCSLLFRTELDKVNLMVVYFLMFIFFLMKIRGTLPDLSEERPVMGGETPVEKVEKTEKQAAKKPSKPREKNAATAKKAAEKSAPAVLHFR